MVNSNLIIKKILLSILLFPFLLNSNIEAIESFSSEKKEYVNYKNEYILGSGDALTIDFLGLDLFSGVYAIKPDGFIDLPEINDVYAKGKTINELKTTLEKKYSEYVYTPEISVSISTYRPLSLTLRGEVNKTGLFKLNYSRLSGGKKTIGSAGLSGIDENQKNSTTYLEPKLFDLIQLGQGITSYADLKNIQIIRDNPLINGGGKIKTTVNLISLLEDGNQQSNITLRDGDDVFIPKSEKILLDQLIEVNKSNLTPDEIVVFINGNVRGKGKILLNQGISLHEAIAAAGGALPMSGNIEFIRLSSNGESQKRILNFNNSAKKGTINNPILISGDIVFVRKNLFGKATSVIKGYSNPVVSAYGLYRLFK